MNKNRFIWGLIFLAAGALLLLFRLDLLTWDWGIFWPWILVGLSVAMHISYFINRRYNVGLLFPAGVLLVYGGLFLAVNAYSITTMDKAWPFFILGPAFGFWEMFLLQPFSKWGVTEGTLIPAVILTFISAAFLLRNYTVFDSHLLLPIAIMVIGAGMLLRSYRRTKIVSTFHDENTGV